MVDQGSSRRIGDGRTLGYHIPKAEVHLLSPQVLLRTIGGQALQTTTNIEISLNKWDQTVCNILS
jgi:hypothetical protein